MISWAKLGEVVMLLLAHRATSCPTLLHDVFSCRRECWWRCLCWGRGRYKTQFLPGLWHSIVECVLDLIRCENGCCTWQPISDIVSKKKVNCSTDIMWCSFLTVIIQKIWSSCLLKSNVCAILSSAIVFFTGQRTIYILYDAHTFYHWSSWSAFLKLVSKEWEVCYPLSFWNFKSMNSSLKCVHVRSHV